MRKLVAPLNPFHSLIGATFANKFTPHILFGTAQHERTVTTAKDATTHMTTAPTPTLSASLSQSVWSPSLTAEPLPSWHVIVWQPHSTHDTTQTIGGMMVRTLLTTTTIGRPNSLD